MLINISNHPLSSWSEEQIASGENMYGKVVDIAFPRIPPEADETDIVKLADQFKNICLNLLSESNDTNNAVHIMGEMTFSFRLVQELKNENITCIASTTKRDVATENNSKFSYFTFVQFREYV